MKERLYVGYTHDPKKRLEYHNAGYVKSTSKDRPWELVAIQETRTENEARWLERQLKKSKGKREKWVLTNDITK